MGEHSKDLEGMYNQLKEQWTQEEYLVHVFPLSTELVPGATPEGMTKEVSWYWNEVCSPANKLTAELLPEDCRKWYYDDIE